MARIRSIKPEFWLDRKLARSLTRDERMLYIGLWNQADEHARAQADPRLIQGQVFPYEEDITPAVIDHMVRSLADVGVVVLYEVGGDPYLFLPKLAKHQRLETKVPSRHPTPPPLDPDQRTLPGFDEVAPGAGSSESHADKSAPDADRSESHADSPALSYVAGSREQGAGTRRADESAPTTKPSRRKAKRPLPDDFTVTDEMRAWHRARGISDRDADRQTERFQANALAKDNRYADWTQAWRNWLDQAVEWGQIRATTGEARGDPDRERVERIRRHNAECPWDPIELPAEARR